MTSILVMHGKTNLFCSRWSALFSSMSSCILVFLCTVKSLVYSKYMKMFWWSLCNYVLVNFFFFLIIVLQTTNLALFMCWVFVHKSFWAELYRKTINYYITPSHKPIKCYMIFSFWENLITFIDKYLEKKKILTVQFHFFFLIMVKFWMIRYMESFELQWSFEERNS